MSFISYAQNFEDVMLWRALGNIEKGFYIDVGANDPVIDSVTKAFYDVGWSGINIEPLGQHITALNQSRPNDINLQMGASNYSGEAELIVPKLRGLASFDERMLVKYQETDYDSIKITVPVSTLDDIWQNHVHDKPVHFLKIDVEAHEKAVIEGLSLDKYRPWIIVVESTLPNTQIENHEEWQSLIIDNNYEMVYFDGLNRYFCAKEHIILKQHFLTPPNVFDNFTRYREYYAVNTLLQFQSMINDWQP